MLDNARLVKPPTPIMREDNWPLLTVERSVFDPNKMENEALDEEEDLDENADKAMNDWDVSGDENEEEKLDVDDLDLDDLDDIDVAGGAWGDDNDSDLDLDDDDL